MRAKTAIMIEESEAAAWERISVHIRLGRLYRTATMTIRTKKNLRLLFRVFHPNRIGSIGSKTLFDIAIIMAGKLFTFFYQLTNCIVPNV